MENFSREKGQREDDTMQSHTFILSSLEFIVCCVMCVCVCVCVGVGGRVCWWWVCVFLCLCVCVCMCVYGERDRVSLLMWESCCVECVFTDTERHPRQYSLRTSGPEWQLKSIMVSESVSWSHPPL